MPGPLTKRLAILFTCVGGILVLGGITYLVYYLVKGSDVGEYIELLGFGGTMLIIGLLLLYYECKTGWRW
ncbi:MAG: hypothetical protein ACFFCT_12660 [Candidatus Odinarchaeota archaeon]|nr:hypothetical protein [Candidatus Thorarchaeota archaeon]